MAVDNVSNSVLNNLSIDKKTAKETETAASKTLGQDAFLKLLITQLKNQSPLDPQDNTQFVAQLAQFSSLEGIQNLNTTVTGLAGGLQSSQALQASALVGRLVEVETNKAYLPKDGIVRGTIELPESTEKLQLRIYDTDDKLVWQQDLGAQKAGELPFVWDGALSETEALPAGVYRFEAIAQGTGKPKALTTWLGNNVNSVTMGANQSVTLNVNGVGAVALADVKNIL